MKTKQIFGLGAIKSPYDPRDFIFSKAISPTELPKKVDLRDLQSPIKNQFRVGSCTGQTLTSAIEYYKLLKRPDDKLAIFSPLFSYYKARELEGTTSYDNGAFFRDNLKSARNEGVALETFWPYDEKKFADAPSFTANFSARFYRIKRFEQLLALQDVLSALSMNDVVPAAFKVFSSIYSDLTRDRGWIIIPKDGEQPIGGHQMLIVGYNLEEKYLILKNSWGNGYGVYGFLFMPFAYYEKFVLDAWRIEI